MTDYGERATFNLGVVVQETGIHPDTLRAWERRYGLPKPERTEGGHRLFSQRDILTVKWLLKRQEEGMRIGQAVELWRELKRSGRDPLQEQPFSDGRADGYGEWVKEDGLGGDKGILEGMRKAWLDAALTFSEPRAVQVIEDALARFPVQVATHEILLKGLREVGDRWFRGEISVQAEHFASSLAERRVQALIAGSPAPWRDDRIAVVCPPQERHSFPSLILSLYLRREGFPVLYLDADVPLLDLTTLPRETSSPLVILSAQTLGTAEGLYRMARILTESGVPNAFGGQIFNHIPALVERIPGDYLGQNLLAVPQEARSLLQRSPSLDRELPDMPERYSLFLDAYRRVEGQVLDDLRRVVDHDPAQRPGIAAAVDHWSGAFKAALLLGDLTLLAYDLGWMEGFFAQRGLGKNDLPRYLEVFADLLSGSVAADGEEVVAWMVQEAARRDEGRA